MPTRRGETQAPRGSFRPPRHNAHVGTLVVKSPQKLGVDDVNEQDRHARDRSRAAAPWAAGSLLHWHDAALWALAAPITRRQSCAAGLGE